MLTLSTELEDNIILVYLYGNNQRYLFFFVSLFASFLINHHKIAKCTTSFTICTFKNDFIPCEVLFSH